MDSAWEIKFGVWASAPPATEKAKCENAIRAVKAAIDKSTALEARSLKVFVQGSYRNKVNVSRDSDVDLGVICNDVFLDQYPDSMSRSDFNISDGNYNISDFKNDLHLALESHFGASQVNRGSKAINVKENTYRVNADVVPLFEFRQYWESGNYRAGVALWDDKKNSRIENYPERLFDYWPTTPLRYENGVTKNNLTNRSYKAVVRILKCLSVEMAAIGFKSADTVPGYLIECLVYNVPNSHFGIGNWSYKVRSVLNYIANNLYKGEWLEVDGIKYLFHGSQPWRLTDAEAFIRDAMITLEKSS